MDKETLQKHFDNPLYHAAHDLWVKVQVGQIIKGAEKYPEPLNPSSWTAAELILHAMQENVDQAHYLAALLSRETEVKKVPVKIKKLNDNAVIPKYAKELDAGFDLVAVEDVIIGPGESAKVPTGLAMELPPGYEVQVRPRSGVSAKTKLRISNAPGTIDAGFRGEIGVLVDNVRFPEYIVKDGEIIQDTDRCVITIDRKEDYSVDREYPLGTYIIRKGDRIAQGVLAAVPIAQFEAVDELEETERGDKGFGSSGVSAG